jgi:hypothetical protein
LVIDTAVHYCVGVRYKLACIVLRAIAQLFCQPAHIHALLAHFLLLSWCCLAFILCTRAVMHICCCPSGTTAVQQQPRQRCRTTRALRALALSWLQRQMQLKVNVMACVGIASACGLHDRKQAAQLRCSSDPSTSAFTTPPAALLLTTCYQPKLQLHHQPSSRVAANQHNMMQQALRIAC